MTHPAHFSPHATSMIWLLMHGVPSQIDTWDYQPELQRQDRKTLVGLDQNTSFFAGQVGLIMNSLFSFQQFGYAGTWPQSCFPRSFSTSMTWQLFTPVTRRPTTTRRRNLR